MEKTSSQLFIEKIVKFGRRTVVVVAVDRCRRRHRTKGVKIRFWSFGSRREVTGDLECVRVSLSQRFLRESKVFFFRSFTCPAASFGFFFFCPVKPGAACCRSIPRIDRNGGSVEWKDFVKDQEKGGSGKVVAQFDIFFSLLASSVRVLFPF